MSLHEFLALDPMKLIELLWPNQGQPQRSEA